MFKRVFNLFALTALIATCSLSAATLHGKISVDSLTGAALSGAKVVIGPRYGGQAATDSIVTGASGLYSFAGVNAGNYAIRVSKTGYVAKSQNFTMSPLTTDTVANLFLVTATFGKILGTVTADSLTGTVISGAKVVVTLRNVGTRVDSMVTGSDGKYLINNVAAGNYTVMVSKATYTSRTVNTAVVGTATDTVNVFLATIQYGKILGTITADSLTGPAIVGAKVIVRQQYNGLVLDSATTGTGGSYTFNTMAAGNYMVVVSKSGYTAKTTNTTVVGTAADTANLFLATATYGKILGTVTADSLSGTVISGAKVVVTLRNVGTRVDSMVTGSDGKYLINNVAAGNYTVTVSKTAYTSRIVNTAVVGTAADTINVFLATIQYGTITVFAKKSTDSTVIAGAAITITTSGFNGTVVTTGTTDNNGRATFPAIVAGNYSVSLSATGYTAQAITTQVQANRIDTVNAYLVVSTQPTKIIKGVVTDSIGALLANVRVSVRIFGATGIITIVDSTDASGAYAILGISGTINATSIAATKTGYADFAAPTVTMTTDTTTYNFKMVVVPTAVTAPGLTSLESKPQITTHNGGLVLSGFTGQAAVTLFTLNGSRIYSGLLTNGSLSLRVAAGSKLLAVIRYNGTTLRTMLTMQ